MSAMGLGAGGVTMLTGQVAEDPPLPEPPLPELPPVPLAPHTFGKVHGCPLLSAPLAVSGLAVVHQRAVYSLPFKLTVWFV